MKLLVLGGYGVFGGRLVELISDIPEIEIAVSGRSLARATAFCEGRTWRAKVRPLDLDRGAIATALKAEAPDLLVDASGPFQDYGDDRYQVIKACIAAKVNYLDFADAADFVFGVSQFDEDAKAADVFVLSGVSSFPVLTAAVLREIAKSMKIRSVEAGIAPSPYAGVGLNVMRAVVGYAGGPVLLTRNGVPTQVAGLTETRRFTIAPPGSLPLRNTLFSLVDVPDLRVIPGEHDLTDIWIGAGPVPEILHRMLVTLARARSAFRLPPLTRLSGLFHRVLNLLRFGEHRGGMFVRAAGTHEGQQVELSWHLLAEGDDGPYIPSMAIEAIIRKVLSGEKPAVGARPATRALELADYDLLFEGRLIVTGWRERAPDGSPLYRRVLGSAFNRLPEQVRMLHLVTQTRTWMGTAKVRRGKGLVSNFIARMIGFPDASDAVPVKVTLQPQEGGELWTRDFGGKTLVSTQKCGTGKNDALLIERFGVVSVALALVVDKNRMSLVPRSWSCLGIPLPGGLLPGGETFETEVDGRFQFNVEIAAPLIGLIVAYKGELELAGSELSA